METPPKQTKGESLSSSRITRRELLKGVAGLSAVSALAACSHTETSPGSKTKTSVLGKSDLIRRENEKPGTRDWLLQKTQIDPSTKYRSTAIEGYCSQTSIRTGEKIGFHVSTNPPSPFTLDLYRMGFYGGTGARHMASLGTFAGGTQTDPPVGKNRLRDCQWKPCTQFKIPADWLSGVYLGKLTATASGLQSYVIFILRDDRPADFIYQCSDTTWQAYNRWPNQYALYDDGKSEWHCGPGVDVSFNRPYGKYCQILDAPLSTGSGEWFLWEFPFVFWLESHGYDVTYISNLDTHSDPKGLLRARGFLSVGHDEYYSLEMYNNLQAAIASGLSVGFFSGNTCCGRIDPRPDGEGTAHRIYGRADYFGPRDEGMMKRFPSMAAFAYASPREDLLLGARSNVPPCTGGADWICTVPDHWIYRETGMKRDDRIAGLIGWEFHGDPPAIAGLEVVATGPTQDAPGKPNGGVYAATVYPGPRRNIVFNASTCWWADGLSEPPGYVRPSVYTSPMGVDSRVQLITRNVLAKMLDA